jgi:hypothetical protein
MGCYAYDSSGNLQRKKTMETEISKCEYCLQQTRCRTLYVALKILEEELRWAKRADLDQKFQELKKDMKLAGYAYPSGGSLCALDNQQKEVSRLLERSETLLRELRRTIRIME